MTLLSSKSFLISWLAIFCCLINENSVSARPLVRNIRSTHEFDRLLEKHVEETGLPIIVDFYSDSCGPCRMMAPIFKKVAQSFKDTAVFVKIDTNAQYELSSRYQVRSLPTFMFFYGNKKKAVFSEVGGIGEERLRQRTRELVTSSELENVKIIYDDFVEYYKQMDPTKTQEDIQSIYDKCAKMNKSKKADKDVCVGGAAAKLIRQLKKKYKSAPKTEKRFLPQPKSEEDNAKKDDSSSKSSSSSSNRRTSSSAKSNKPNLQLATKEELLLELEKREDEERDQQVEEENEDEEEVDPRFKTWVRTDFPERVVIVGSGPAGMAAALYAARAALDPLVIAPSMGGQLQGKGVDVENYPGLHNVTGPAIIASMRTQAATFGAMFEDDVVVAVDASTKPIKIVTNNTGTIYTHTLIVATGAESQWLNIPGEYDMRGGGVSSCATCDGFLFSGKDVIVVGGGDAAMEDALVLARTSKSVTVVHRRDSFRASKVLAERVMNHPSITVKWNATLEEIVGKPMEMSNENAEQREEETEIDLDSENAVDSNVQKIVTGAIVKDVNTGEKVKYACDAVFVAIGHKPSTEFLEGVVEFDPDHTGYILTRKSHSGALTHTSVPGIFAAGDVSDAIYRQAITSAGSGAAAALDAERYLSENGLGNEAALFEAELLAELMADSSSDNNSNKEEEYNIYNEATRIGVGVKESIKAEL